MDSSRQEYPAMLAFLQPAQAVTVLSDRVKLVDKVNKDIANWLSERRRVEEQYVQGLRKLARITPPDESSELGVFTAPWQGVVRAALALAESHQMLAQKIEIDVERPLRDFSTTNREMQAMSTMQGNMGSMAKDFEIAQKKSERIKEKSGKVTSSKVADASSDLGNAASQWENQAPYVFETLQAVDETRLNHLRDVLTQYQTHEVDQIQRNRKTAEQCLNALLNVETAEEIKAFSIKYSGGRQREGPDRRGSRNLPSHPLVPTTSGSVPEDTTSQRSGSIHEEKKRGLSGLKRLGTVIGRRRQSTQPLPFGRPSPSGQKKSASFHTVNEGRSTRLNDRPDTFSPQQNPRSPSPGFFAASPPRQAQPPSRSDFDTGRTLIEQARNGPNNPVSSSGLTNGIDASQVMPQLQTPLQPTVPLSPARNFSYQEAPTDAEGYNVPPSTNDAISQAEQEASNIFDSPAPQLKVDIRNAPISEEGQDADTIMADMASTLRAQAAPARRIGTSRGRRDVRNTMFLPSLSGPDLPAQSQQLSSPFQTSSGLSPPIGSFSSSQLGHRQLGSEEHAGSDTQSIRSAGSVPIAGQAVKHPDMYQRGLNSSVVETVSAWLDHGQVTRAVVIGELALAYNSEFPSPSGTEIIRLENFPNLEKVAPNPAFIKPTATSPGEYTVDVGNLSRTAVAFKYQVHVEQTSIARQAPVILSPSWKVESTQTSVILQYSLNPAFTHESQQPTVTLGNFVLIIHLGEGKATSCQSRPAGAFSRDKGLIYWRLDDLVLKVGAPPEKVLARFATDGEATPGRVEARWEISGGQADRFGSGLGVSYQDDAGPTGGHDGSDPFADEELSERPAMHWKDVRTVRKLVSGTYQAT